METFQWALYEAVGSLVSPSRPLLSPSFQLSCFVPCDTILESTNISYDINLHTFTAELLCPHSTEDKTQLCMPGDVSSECLPNNEYNRKRGAEFCSSSLTSFGVGRSLQIHRPCQILSLYLRTLITYSTFPHRSVLPFAHFLPVPSASLIFHSLLPLISWPSLGRRVILK